MIIVLIPNFLKSHVFDKSYQKAMPTSELQDANQQISGGFHLIELMLPIHYCAIITISP